MSYSTVFHQVVNLISRTEFESIVAKYNGNMGVRKLDCWTWFVALLFGQMSGHDSIRAIERLFAHKDPQMQKLGFGPVRRSTLADANAHRQVIILEDLFKYCLAMAYQYAPRKHRLRFCGDVFALDSTTIELCLKLCPWARFHHEKTGKGAVKLHTAIDIANDLPQFAIITDGRQHDVKVAKQNLRIKKFLGTSLNAVKSQILVALIAYLLVQILRYSLKSNISITDAMAVIGTLLLLKEPISRLLGELPRTCRHPPNPQLCFKLF